MIIDVIARKEGQHKHYTIGRRVVRYLPRGGDMLRIRTPHGSLTAIVDMLAMDALEVSENALELETHDLPIVTVTVWPESFKRFDLMAADGSATYHGVETVDEDETLHTYRAQAPETYASTFGDRGVST